MHKSEILFLLTMQLNDRTNILNKLKEERRNIEVFFESEEEKTKQEIDQMLKKMHENLQEYEEVTKELEDIAKHSLDLLNDLK